ncbi:MAG: hypothetical protein ACE5HC_05185 [Candidatus Binatia bacterium]
MKIRGLKPKKPNLLFLVLAIAFIALGSGVPVVRSQAGVDYVQDAAKIVKATDWSKVKTVTVRLKEFSFNPNGLRFEKDTPYKLEIKNTGTEKHYFVATTFFKAVASRKVQSNTDGEIKAPYFTALEVFPGRQLDFYFVPVKQGSYYLLCTVEGHEDQGMHGSLVIK